MGERGWGSEKMVDETRQEEHEELFELLWPLIQCKMFRLFFAKRESLNSPQCYFCSECSFRERTGLWNDAKSQIFNVDLKNFIRSMRAVLLFESTEKILLKIQNLFIECMTTR